MKNNIPQKIFIIISIVIPLYSNEDIFISILQKPQSFITTPANTAVITEDDIKNTNAISVAQILDIKKGIFTKDILNNNKPSLDIRGFGETGNSNILILINGKRANNIDMSVVDLNQIPIKDVERIEIIYGGGSVLYGDNATAGVVNIITKKVNKSVIEFDANYNSFLTSDLNVSIDQILKENFSLRFNINNSNFKGFRDNNSFASYHINWFINTKIKSGLNFEIKTDFYQDSFGLPGPVKEIDYLNNNITKSNTPYDSGATPYNINIQLLTSKNIGDNKNIVMEINQRNTKQETNWPSFGMFAFYDVRNTNANQVVLRYSQENILFSNNNFFQLGIDYFNSKYEVCQYSEKERLNKTQDVEISRNSFAGYLVDKIDLLYNTNLNFGYRIENVNNDFNNIIAKTNNNLQTFVNSFEISFGWLYKKQLNLSLNYANAYRLPKTDEYYDVWSGLNDKLKNQISKQISFNAKYLLKQNYTFMISLYNMNTENELYYDPIMFSNSNYDKTSRCGAELEAYLKPINLIDTNLSYSYTKTKFDGGNFDGKELTLVPQNIINWNIKFNLNSYVSFNIFNKFVSERKFMNDIEGKYGKLESYLVTNTKLTYKKGLLTLSIGIDNVLDTKYSPAGAVGPTGNKVFYPAMPRNYSIGLSILL